MMYKVYSYDVWGNNQEGYEVNNVFPALISQSGSIFDAREVYIRLTEDSTDADIIKALKNRGLINKKMRFNSFTIDGESQYTLYVNVNNSRYCNYPLYELRRLSDDEMQDILESEEV